MLKENLGEDRRVRMVLSQNGEFDIQHELFNISDAIYKVIFCKTPIDKKSMFQRFKTSHRDFYEKNYQKAISRGYDEVLFVNEDGNVVEGSRHNIFVKKDGQFLTPPVSDGALPGVLRHSLLESQNLNAFIKMENLLKFLFFYNSPQLTFQYRDFGSLNYIKQSSVWSKTEFFSLLNPSQNQCAIENPIQKTMFDHYRWTFNNEKVILSQTIVSGMSGSPLIAKAMNSPEIDRAVRYLLGIGIQADFDFKESIFASYKSLSELLNKYIAKSKESEGSTDTTNRNLLTKL